MTLPHVRERIEDITPQPRKKPLARDDTLKGLSKFSMLRVISSPWLSQIGRLYSAVCFHSKSQSTTSLRFAHCHKLQRGPGTEPELKISSKPPKSLEKKAKHSKKQGIPRKAKKQGNTKKNKEKKIRVNCRVAQEPKLPNRNRKPEPSELFFHESKSEPEPPELFFRNLFRNRPSLLICTETQENENSLPQTNRLHRLSRSTTEP